MPAVFDKVVYYLQGQESDEVKKLLKDGGAMREFHLTDMVTHVIASSQSDSLEMEDLDVPVVLAEWVEASSTCGTLLPCAPYLLSPERLFSGIVACPSQMTSQDRLHLWAMVTYHGGHMKLQLDNTCTHLVLPRPAGAKYLHACKLGGRLAIVTPGWILDSIQEGRKLPQVDYSLLPPTSQAEVVPSHHADRSAAAVAASESSPTTAAAASAVTSDASGESAAFPPARPVAPIAVAAAAASLASEYVRVLSNDSLISAPPATWTHGPAGALLLPPEDTTRSGGASGGLSQSNSPPFLDPRFAMPPGKLHERAAAADAPGRHPSSGVVGVTPTKDVSPSAPAAALTTAMAAAAASAASQRSGGAATAAAGPPPCLVQTQGAVSSASAAGAHHTAAAPIRGNEAAAALSTASPDKTLRSECNDVLRGAVFTFADYQDSMSAKTMDHWREIVTVNGGVVLDQYTPDCTHVLAMNRQGAVCQQAMRAGKKVVAAHWLNDVLESGAMFTPTLALHFPTVFRECVDTCPEMTISLSGYERPQRLCIRDMVQLTGAEFTNTLSRLNTHLICKKAEGQKYQRALEWGIPIVNGRWLADVVMDNKIPDVKLSRYKEFGRADELNFNPQLAHALLAPWMPKPKDSKVTLTRASLSSSAEVGAPPPKRERVVVRRVMFTTLPVALSQDLRRTVLQLGGELVSDVTLCTHMVARRVARTVKFMGAISIAKFILDPSWVIDSKQEGKFLSEGLYELRDADGERQMNFSLATSLQRRSVRNRPLLRGLKVYCTPSVEPPAYDMRTVVECAGGTVFATVTEGSNLAVDVRDLVVDLVHETQLLDTAPSDAELALAKTQNPPALVVLSASPDVRLCKPFVRHGITVHTSEVILEAVLTQEIDLSRHQLISAGAT